MWGSGFATAVSGGATCPESVRRHRGVTQLRAPRAQRPKKSGEILDRERQGERGRNNAQIPQHQHRRRDQRPIEQRSEHEPGGVQPSTCDVEHAQSAHQQRPEPEIIRPPPGQRRQMQRRRNEGRRQHHDNGFEQNHPAEHFHRLGGASLSFGAQQAAEHFVYRGNLHGRAFLIFQRSADSANLRRPFLPPCNVTAKYAKQRVRLRTFYPGETRPPRGVACSEFFHQVLPLERELSPADAQVAGRPRTADLLRREIVAADHRFVVHHTQVFSDISGRPSLLAEADQLGVMNVSASLPPEDGLGQKPLAPQGYQPARVQILRMQAPDAHGAYYPQPNTLWKYVIDMKQNVTNSYSLSLAVRAIHHDSTPNVAPTAARNVQNQAKPFASAS